MKDFFELKIKPSEMNLEELKEARKIIKNLLYEISYEMVLRSKKDVLSKSEKNSASS